MNKIFYVMVLAATIGLFSGCTAEKQAENSDEQNQMMEEEQEELVEYVLTPEDDLAMGVIMMEEANSEEYPELEVFLREYYQIPEEYRALTRYYYTFANLSEAEMYEVFVAVIGEYTEQENGDPALILTVKEDGSFDVVKAFDNIHTPVIVSTDVTNGWHDIIYQVYGKNVEDGYLTWKYQKDTGYQAEEILLDEPPTAGMRILANNLIDDLDRGNYLTLEDD